MDMDMHMGGDSASAVPALSADGVDFSNSTQAAEFLEDLLNDDELKIIGNKYATYFWYGVIVAIGIATLANFLQWLTLQLRLRAAARRRQQPARPQSMLSKWLATATALSREISYGQITPTARMLWFKVPPLGTIILLLCYLSFVLALEFINNDVAGAQYWQALGVRAGWLSVAQMPLLILLINKNNVIGVLTGTSYERLNVLHRWSSRIMLLMAILHFGYQSYGWQQYPGLMQLEWATDDCPITGIAAFTILLWMNLSTLAPARYWSYEFFVIQHIITFFGFVIAVVYHLPSTALGSRVYIFIPIGLYLVDRIIRSLLYAWTNMRASRATMIQLGGVTEITLTNKAIKTWRAGSHVLLSVPRFGVMQSHPATILSSPQSHNGALVFLLKSHKGFTLRIMEGADSSETALLPHSKEGADTEQHAQVTNMQHLALLDGPYGGSQSDMASFDSVCLLSGSTGVTFTLSLLQDLADRASSCGKKLPVQQIHFIWCIRSSEQARWVSDELENAHRKLQRAGIDIRISIHVTCAEQFTELGNEPKECGCACDKSQGPCCCVLVDEDDEGVDVDANKPADGEKKVATVKETSASSSPTRQPLTSGRRMPVLPCATFYSGRPDIRETISNLLDGAEGESGIAVCGPIGLSSEVRNTVVRLSDERAIHKGTSAQGCYLHVEAFS